MSSNYRNLTAQCLVLADPTQPVAFMLETLILHIYADYGRTKDAEFGLFISTGVMARVALRMGLHRDSAPYKGISVFQGEMRRRVWAAIRFLDLVGSMQMGLPPVIRPRDTNTEVPRNLYDDELFEEMDTLPPSRPETEATPALFLINRTRLMNKLGEAVELTETLTCADYDDVLKLDSQARNLRGNVSPHLKLRSMDESARDTSSLIMQRFALDLLYLKIICTLHRKFLCASRQNRRFFFSRQACLEACMTMLQHQATIHRECQPGGRLRCVKWFISSLTTADFLLAAMIVALDLYHTARAERHGRTSPGDGYLWGQDRDGEKLDAIETAVMIWDGLKDQSMEAYKAHATLSVMLTQLKEHRAMRQAKQSFSSTSGTSFSASPVDDPNVAPEHSAAISLGMLSTGGMPASSANMFDTRFQTSMPNTLNENMVSSSAGPPPSFGAADTAPAGLFSNLFGGNMNFPSMDLPNTDNNNIDWVSSSIAGSCREVPLTH
jgi:hypothetical protein